MTHLPSELPSIAAEVSREWEALDAACEREDGEAVAAACRRRSALVKRAATLPAQTPAELSIKAAIIAREMDPMTEIDGQLILSLLADVMQYGLLSTSCKIDQV